MIDQKDKALVGLAVANANAEAVQVRRVMLHRVEAVKRNRLIADETRAAIGQCRAHKPRVHVALGAAEEEAAGLIERIDSRQIKVDSVHEVGRSRRGQPQFQDIDVMWIAVAW